MKKLIIVLLFACAASPLLGQAPTAPAEPDFLGDGGATVTLGGTTYTIRVEQIHDDLDQWHHNVVTVAVGDTETVYDPATTTAPVNGPGDLAIQIWVGSPAPDTQLARIGTPWTSHPAVMIGLDGSDIMAGTSHQDIMVGNAGGDTMVGDGGDDQIWSGAGSDQVFGVGGDDSIVGGTENDNDFFPALPDGVSDPGDGVKGLVGGEGSDSIWGEAGEDNLEGDDGADTLVGGTEDDELMGWGGNDTIWCGDGDDAARGHLGNDTIYGESGNDTITGSEGKDTIFGGAGDDPILDGFGLSGNDPALD